MMTLLETVDILHFISPYMAAINPGLVCQEVIKTMTKELTTLYASPQIHLDPEPDISQGIGRMQGPRVASTVRSADVYGATLYEIHPEVTITNGRFGPISIVVKRKAEEQLSKANAKILKGGENKSQDKQLPLKREIPYVGAKAQRRRRILRIDDEDHYASELLRCAVIGCATDVDENALVKLLKKRGFIALCDTTLTGSNSIITIPPILWYNQLTVELGNNPQYCINASRGDRRAISIPEDLFFAFLSAVKKKYPDSVRTAKNGLKLTIDGLPMVSICRYSTLGGGWDVKVTIMTGHDNVETITQILDYIIKCFDTLATSQSLDIDFYSIQF
jgi:hypothetical protein